jgi:hypothetical protein
VSCDLSAGSGSGAWLIFDRRTSQRREVSGRGMRFIIKVILCEPCLPLVFERATPTDRPYATEVPGREWPFWPARTRVS